MLFGKLTKLLAFDWLGGGEETLNGVKRFKIVVEILRQSSCQIIGALLTSESDAAVLP